MISTTTEEFFEAKYQASEDPWSFSRSPYELGRYHAILNSVGDSSYKLAFEPGCSVGVLTEMLAARCERIEAYDISPTAVRNARLRCMREKSVHVFQASMQSILPSGADLYLLCEVGYYLTQTQLSALLEQHVACLRPGAAVIGCHWLGHSADHVLNGDEVHATIQRTPALVHQWGERYEGFRLDRWIKQETKS
jgi:hypothetical protein